ncbi:MAG TPA: hypothetical protein VMD92_17340 [Acidobacteriaceae bacterium]|jgi:hypothetical protein|nr:hypothetical protein [Acidobacteriaceae bacterium]
MHPRLWQATAFFPAATATLTAQTSASFEMNLDTNPAISAGTVVAGDFNGDSKPDVIQAAGCEREPVSDAKTVTVG